MLLELIQYLAVLLDQEGAGRHRAERVQNLEVLYVQCVIGWSVKKFDYINRVTKRFRFRSTRVRRNTLPLVAMHLLDRSCMIVGKF